MDIRLGLFGEKVGSGLRTLPNGVTEEWTIYVHPQDGMLHKRTDYYRTRLVQQIQANGSVNLVSVKIPLTAHKPAKRKATPQKSRHTQDTYQGMICGLRFFGGSGVTFK